MCTNCAVVLLPQKQVFTLHSTTIHVCVCNYCAHQGLWGPGTEYPAFSKKDKDPNAAKDVDNADVANTNGNTNGKNKGKKRKQQAVGANAGADSDSGSDSEDDNAAAAGTGAAAGAAAAAGGGGAAGGGKKSGKPQRNEARDNKCFLQVMKAGGVSTAMCLQSLRAILVVLVVVRYTSTKRSVAGTTQSLSLVQTAVTTTTDAATIARQ
jgi:hypothetical protein